MRLRQLIEELVAAVEDHPPVGGPRWQRPDVEQEKGELARTRKTLRLPAPKLHAALAKAKLGALSDKHWKNLQNTWSYKVKRKDHVKWAKEIGRDTKRLDKGFKEGHKMPAPIVLHRKNKPPYLVAGNTRLSAASVHGVRPKVLHVRVKD